MAAHEGSAEGPGRRTRVLIAENHRDLSEALGRLIDAEPDLRCVGQVASHDEVVPAARDSSADVLILDLSLEGGSGMDLIERLARELPALRIVVFSGLSDDELEREALRRGAAGYVTKGADFGVLLGELRRRFQPAR